MLKSNPLFGNVGIDSIGFYAPRYYIDLMELSEKRNIDPNKLKFGLMLKELRTPDIGEDIVSMGLKAAYNALIKGNINPKKIDAIFVGTETITYAVKSVSNILAELLGISINSITQDVYNACAAATLALLNATSLIQNGIIKRALIIGADISYYEIGSSGEPTQGAGAVALIISKNPRIAIFSKKFGKISGNIDDFFRPPGVKEAQVFGKYSVNSYLNFQLGAYDDLVKNIGNFSANFYVFHAPYSKLPIKCMQQIILKRWNNNINDLLKIKTYDSIKSIQKKIENIIQDIGIIPEFIVNKLKKYNMSTDYIEKIKDKIYLIIKNRVLPQLKVPMHFGNMYSASVWSQIIYILENFAKANDIIYFGSYGSGATCISGLLKVVPGFESIVQKEPKLDFYLKNKIRRKVSEYEKLRMGQYKEVITIGKIKKYKDNNNRGFYLNFCDKGCIIPSIKGLNYCPKGHSGFYRKFFPLIAELVSEPIEIDANDLSFIKEDMVRILGHPKIGDLLEFDLRRVKVPESENSEVKGLILWTPTYIPIDKQATPYI